MFGFKLVRESDYKSKAKTGTVVIPDSQIQNNQLQRVLYQMLVNGTVAYYDKNVNTFIDKGYIFNPHAYTVINFIARNISQVPKTVNIVKDKKNHREYLRQKGLGNHAEAEIFKVKALERIENGGLVDLFKHPNPNQGITEYMFEKIGYRYLTGNSYVYGLTPEGFEDDFFAQLFVAPSQIMEIVQGGWQDPVKGYKIQWMWGEYSEIPKDKIIHQKLWNPKADMRGPSPYGLSPLEPLLRNLKRSNESIDGSLALLKNGAPAGVMSNESDTVMTTEERKAAQEMLNKEFGGGTNLNKVLQAGSKVSWQQIGLSSVDLELLASDKIDLATFSRAYGIDIVIFDQDVSSYNNKLIAKKSVWEDTLIPILNEERDSDNKVAKAWSKRDGIEYFIDYDITGVPCLQPDREKLMGMVEKAIKIGVLNRNEGRIALAYDRIDNNPDMEAYETDLSKSNNVNFNNPAK